MGSSYQIIVIIFKTDNAFTTLVKLEEVFNRVKDVIPDF